MCLLSLVHDNFGLNLIWIGWPRKGSTVSPEDLQVVRKCPWPCNQWSWSPNEAADTPGVINGGVFQVESTLETTKKEMGSAFLGSVLLCLRGCQKVEACWEITHIINIWLQHSLGSFACIIIGPEPLKHAFFPIDFVREIAYRIIP